MKNSCTRGNDPEREGVRKQRKNSPEMLTLVRKGMHFAIADENRCVSGNYWSTI
jgi:hypothetical protein